jgi:hypothetical protein
MEKNLQIAAGVGASKVSRKGDVAKGYLRD